jgi:hypothetical protein
MPAEIELKYSLTSAHTMEHMIKDELIQHYIKGSLQAERNPLRLL